MTFRPFFWCFVALTSQACFSISSLSNAPMPGPDGAVESGTDARKPERGSADSSHARGDDSDPQSPSACSGTGAAGDRA